MHLSFPGAQLSRILHPLAAFGKQSGSIMVLQLTGSCFLDLANISLKPEQRQAVLYCSYLVTSTPSQPSAARETALWNLVT